MPREKDFAWAYCDKIPGKAMLLCKFCQKECSGGIYRFKFHLAKIPGHDISLCGKVDDNVKYQAALALDMLEQHNAKKARQNAEIGTVGVDTFSTTSPMSPQSVESSMSFPSFPHMPPRPSQTQSHASPSTPSFNTRGPGFKAPTSESLRTDMLLESVQDVMLVLAEFRSSWVETGCTIMSDGWTDQRNRTLINFLVSCPAGTMFLKSVDASDKVKTAQLICEMMEEVVQEVGEEHVVQIVTDNAANYMAAGRLFEMKHPTIFWTSCVAHSIDLMLEDIGKLHWIHEVVEKAKSITKYLYNHTIVLNTMRIYTEGKEIVQPAVTRFATNFISLQSVVEQKINLKRMFLGHEWMGSKHSKTPEGIEIAALVFNDGFWKDVEEIIAVTESLVRVLRMVDGDKPVMGYIYEAMDLAKEAIKRRYGGDETKYTPLWDIIDARWDRQLHSPLHAAGYFLNPQYFYDKSKFNEDGEVGRELMTCVERCFPDPEQQSRVVSQLQDYRAPSKLFAYTSAIRQRSKMLPVFSTSNLLLTNPYHLLGLWWQNFGSDTPDLKKFAIRILNQACSASGCERNWSMFEKIHSKKRNRLTQKRLNDLVFVHYNLRLRNKQIQGMDHSPIDLEEIDLQATNATDWVQLDEPPLLTLHDLENFESQASEGVDGIASSSHS
eukprot:PITA_13226